MRYVGGIIGSSPNQSQKIEYIGGLANSFAGFIGTVAANTTLEFSKLGNVQPDDLVLAIYSSSAIVNNNIDIVTADYTRLRYDYLNSTFDINMLIAYKRMGNPVDANIQFRTTGSTAQGGSIAALVFRNVDKANPFDVTTTVSSSATTGIPNPAAITPVTKNAVIVCLGASALNGTVASEGFKTPNLYNFITSSAQETDGDPVVGAGIYTSWVSGSFDPGAWSIPVADSTSYSYASATLALRPQRPSGVVTLEDIYNIQNH